MPSSTTEDNAKNGVVDQRGPARGRSNLPVDKAEQAKASSAHNRINVPLNVEHWRKLPAEAQAALIWFHQHLLDEQLSWDDACEALDYDRTTVFRVLKGTYGASYDGVIARIESYKRLWMERRTIKRAVFADNAVSRLIHSGLDYAMHVGGITEIQGESGQGKTYAVREWMERNNHGRTVYVEAPVFGAVKGLLREICQAVGANRNQSTLQMTDSIRRAFNGNRMLIVDEASRMLPNDSRTPPRNLDFLREIHDKTGCALALVTTVRFGETLRQNTYMFEQLLGRIDVPIRLPHRMDEQSWLPLVEQYLPQPSKKLRALCEEIANEEIGGRMRMLAKLLQFASHIAGKRSEPLAEEHVFQAVGIRRQMAGETMVAKRK